MKFPETIPLRRDALESGQSAGLSASDWALLGIVVFIGFVVWAWWRRSARDQQNDTSAQKGEIHWRRWLASNAQPTVKCKTVARLGAKHTLYEVEWQGKLLLIGCSSQTAQLLAEVPCTQAQAAERA